MLYRIRPLQFSELRERDYHEGSHHSLYASVIGESLGSYNVEVHLNEDGTAADAWDNGQPAILNWCYDEYYDEGQQYAPSLIAAMMLADKHHIERIELVIEEVKVA